MWFQVKTFRCSQTGLFLALSAGTIRVIKAVYLSNIISSKMRLKKVLPIAGIVISTALILSSCSPGDQARKKQDLVIFHAGSLSVPFKMIAESFKKENPDVNILMEAAGSRRCARKITDLGRACDIMASADYTVINSLLIPDHASWNLKFASNEMAIVYREGSKRSNEISRENWYEILLEEDVAFGRSDPDSDPCGYRAVLTMRLAGIFYESAGLADRLLIKDRRYIRPKETDLLALLESGAIDYIFLYRSVASQHGLKYLVLPDEINMKKPVLADYYGRVSVDISGKQPGTKVMKKGAPMVYGVTIPKNAPNPELAVTFIEFLLDREKGMALMESCGQPSVVPSPTLTFEMLPARLKKYGLSPGKGGENGG